MNNKFVRIVVLCCFYLGIVNLNLHAIKPPEKTGYITGKLFDEQKEPLFYVAVFIEGTNIGDYTNEKGEFKLTNVPIGKQTIVVSGIGIEKLKRTVQVTPNQTTKVGDIETNNSIQLKEVAIEGKSQVRKQQEQAYAVTVLDIKKAYNTVAPLNKLLNSVSSVRIREEGGVGSNYNFSMNGFSGNQVKFFLDGIPMDNFGSSFNLSNISVNMAERIEVYKGILPVSLGADALGGAVNIISRKDANYLDASYSIGSFNTHRASINGAYTDMKSGFTVRANTYYNYSDNNYKVYAPIIDLTTNKKIDDSWVKRFHDDYQSAGIRMETGIVNKPYADYLLVGMIASGNKKDIQTGATMDAVYGEVQSRSESMIPSIRYKKDNLFTDGLSLSLYGAYSHVNTFYTDTASSKYNWLGESIQTGNNGEKIHSDSKIQNGEWLSNANVSYALNSHQFITLNHVYSSMNRKIHDKIDPENESNKIPQKLTKNITGLSWETKYDRWNVNLFGKLYNTSSSTYKRLDEYTENARLEKVADKKTNIGYGIAATYFILPKLQAKASYEKAYRLPESTEMFGDGLIQQRNPDLKPESSDNINLGVIFEQRVNDHLFYIESNYIWRHTKDFILKGVELTSNPTTGYQNLGKVQTNGVEGSVKYTWKKLFHIGANLTYQNIIDNQQFEKNTDSFVGEGIIEHISYKERLPNIPYLFGNGDLGFSFQNVGLKESELTLDYSFNYVKQYYLSFPGLGAKASKKLIPTQRSHDVSVGYTFGQGRYSIIAECSNLTDAKLYDNYRLQKPGRAFNLKLRYFLK